MAAWQNLVIPIIRLAVDDYGPTYSYDDGRLEEIAVIAAHYVVREVDFSIEYTLNIENASIEPDPSSDKDFINLVALKAATLVVYGEVKQSAGKSFNISDGLSSISTGSNFDAKMDFYKDLLKQYNAYKMAYRLGAGQTGQIIVGAMPRDGVDGRPENNL